jgi:hypothetical protein
MKKIILLGLLLFAQSASAQEGFSIQLEQLPSGDGKVSVFVSRTDTPINAVEGTLRFDERADISNVQTGESVALFWVEPPRIEKNTIRFSGLMPSGFSSVIGSPTGDGFLFSVNVSPRVGDVVLEESAVFAHDGEGTRIAVSDRTLSLEGEAPTIEEHIDTTPPEWVFAERGSTSELPAFVVLLAEDRESGISHFEVRESGGEWKRTSTPYIVQHDSWFNRIDVRAYDYAGNVRKTTLISKVEEKTLLALPYAVGVIFGVLLIVYLWKRFRRTHS